MDKKIIMSLETIMGDRFGKYSKYIIQDRALPDVRDGLKPVQRRKKEIYIQNHIVSQQKQLGTLLVIIILMETHQYMMQWSVYPKIGKCVFH